MYFYFLLPETLKSVGVTFIWLTDEKHILTDPIYKKEFTIKIKPQLSLPPLLYQGVMIEHDEAGKILRTLDVHTDITYLKQEGIPMLSFMGTEGEPSYLDVACNKQKRFRSDL